MLAGLLPLLLVVIATPVAAAKRALTASSLVACMPNSQISPTYFNVTFDPDDRSLRYSLQLNTRISSYVIAHLQVYAYGFLIIQKDVDVCTLGWKQFCPLYPGPLQIDSIQYISEDYVKQIPGIAYTVPDIDAVVKMVVKDRSTGETLSCIQSSFSNGKTINQVGAKWATAVVAGLGLLIAAVLSTFGNSNAASHVSANAVTLFLYFQSVVVVSFQHVERVPPIASAWAENLAWSMGLIRVQFMQDIFRWYVQATGGTPTTYFKGVTKQILVQRGLRSVSALSNSISQSPVGTVSKRALDFALNSNAYLVVLRGIKRIGYGSHIEPTSIVVTGFTFFVLCGLLLTVAVVFVRLVVQLLIRTKKINPNRMSHFRTSFHYILKGTLLRYLYIGFMQLVILSLWEFTQRDSPAVIVLAALFLILSLGVIGFALYKTVTFGRISIATYKNPAALLYGDSKILHKFGFCYTMFNADKYWFGTVLMSYCLVKAIFISLCQAAGKVSVVVIFLLDLAYTIFLIIKAPYLDKSTNVVNYCVAIVNTINSFLFMFFSDLFGQPASVSSIMGWVFFILNAAFSLVLLVMIIVLIVMAVVSKNPDARFAPARDDRTSFQRQSSIKYKGQNPNENSDSANELAALGIAAQDHSNDWESEMYRLNVLNNSHGSINPKDDMFTPSQYQQEKFSDDSMEEKVEPVLEDSDLTEQEKNQSLGAKWKNKIVRTLSTKAKDNNGTGQKNISRLSDTLLDDQNDSEDNDHLSPIKYPGLLHVPKSSSSTPINQHHRNESNLSGYSNYSSNHPTNAKNVL